MAAAIFYRQSYKAVNLVANVLFSIDLVKTLTILFPLCLWNLKGAMILK